MDTELLREQFKNAIPAAKNVLAEHQNTWGDMLPMNLGIEVEELKPLLITLESQPEFATFRGHVDGYGTPLSPRYLFPRLLRVAVDQGPDASVGWLQKVISTRRAEAKCFFLLSGLRDLECTIELLPGLRLVPFNQLEETSATRMLQKTAAGGGNLFQYQLPANVALVRELIVPEFATNTNKFVLHSNLLEMESLIHLLGIFHESLRPEIGWYDYNDPDLRMVRVGFGHRPAATDIRNAHAMQEAPRTRTYRRILAAYTGLDVSNRNVIDLAAQ